jgi:DNA invertase Pin-like site-specific DNA recombinase
MALIGYARVSTLDQHLTGQLDALKAAGASTIYREKVSGVRAGRPQLTKLMASLKPKDIVVVTKLDRLGRSTRELLDLIDRVSKAGASFRSLGDRSGIRRVRKAVYYQHCWPRSRSLSVSLSASAPGMVVSGLWPGA